MSNKKVSVLKEETKREFLSSGKRSRSPQHQTIYDAKQKIAEAKNLIRSYEIASQTIRNIEILSQSGRISNIDRTIDEIHNISKDIPQRLEELLDLSKY